MATKTEDRLFKEFSKVSSASVKADVSALAGPPAPASAQPTVSPAPTQTVESAFSAASDTIGEAASYHGVSGSSSYSQSNSSASDGGVLGSLEGVGKDMLSGLGLIPMIGSLFGLFGGDAPAKPTFEKYNLPPSIDFSGAVVGDSLTNSDYDQYGTSRLYDADAPGSSPAANAAASPTPPSSSASSTAAAGSTPQINVNVQAMDAKSFMDYSGQIAQAVRDAMLNMSSINDVVTEL